MWTSMAQEGGSAKMMIKQTNIESEVQTSLEHTEWLEQKLEELLTQIEEMEKFIEELECSQN